MSRIVEMAKLHAEATGVMLVLVVGVMGRETADGLAAAGFPVSAWTRSPRQHKGVT